MITLSTANDYPLKTVFDYLADHMLTQGQKCDKLHDDQLRSPIGLLIPDDDYKPEMEECNNLLEGIEQPTATLIASIQAIHDHYSSCNWEPWLATMSMFWGLNYYNEETRADLMRILANEPRTAIGNPGNATMR